jgi:hypothetical protein
LDQAANAGNEGDVVKHPALLAMLRSVLSSGSGPFLYADSYAGSVSYQLPPNGKWRTGIAKFNVAAAAQLPSSSAVGTWSARYLRSRPIGVGSIYPGSCRIAADEAAAKGATLQVAAWDTSPVALVSVASEIATARTHSCPASASDPGIRNADLLFIDPWSNTEWPRVRALMEAAPRSLLVWMPLYPAGSGNKKGVKRTPAMKREGDTSRRIRAKSLQLGFNVARVRWDFDPTSTRDMIGCQLLFRASSDPSTVDAIRNAVDEAATLMGWTAPHPAEPVVCHFMP